MIECHVISSLIHLGVQYLPGSSVKLPHDVFLRLSDLGVVESKAEQEAKADLAAKLAAVQAEADAKAAKVRESVIADAKAEAELEAEAAAEHADAKPARKRGR